MQAESSTEKEGMKIRWLIVASLLCFWIGLAFIMLSSLRYLAWPTHFGREVVAEFPEHQLNFSKLEVQIAAEAAYTKHFSRPKLYGQGFTLLIASQILLFASHWLGRAKRIRNANGAIN